MAEVPLVTIVTPSYNQGPFLEETLKSVLSQEGDFFLEYLVMDGGSSDDSVGILRRYDHLVKDGRWRSGCRGVRFSWLSEKDGGQADAINKGFQAATGSILAYLNSDDTYLPGAVDNAVKHLSSRPDEALLYGEGYHIARDGARLERYYTEPFDFGRLAEICFILQPTVFLRRSLFEALGPFNKDLQYCMDYEYWIRAAKRFKIGYSPRYTANFRVYPESKTSSKRLEIPLQIVPVLREQLGCVRVNWLRGLADERIERLLSRDGAFRRVVRKVLIEALWRLLYLRYNGRLPFGIRESRAQPR